ncbi:MAG TPA: peptide chain release factor 2, partial [Bacillota bacterium]|nr:peptide chain release factor 2 [Bacillota bacterium]
MRAELSTPIEELRSRIEQMKGYLLIDEKLKKLDELHVQAAVPGLWDDREAAQALMQRISEIEKHV